MGLINGIQCDICGRRDLWEWTCGKLYIERWARADGWKIGKRCRCPDCVKKVKEGKKKNEEIL